jgi:quercetin dioxygenase-like cupin family protein
MSHSVKLNELIFTTTAHNAGRKKILFNETGSALTQFAYGSLLGGEIISSHSHDTMDEYFYFLKGTGIYKIGDETIELIPGTAIAITHGVAHELSAETTLEFVYFGIAV